MSSSKTIQIVPYQTKYQTAFKQLNQAWIENYFTMEAADYQVLDHPESYILQKGGAIVVALCEEIPVGVCALIKLQEQNYDYELAKMAVAPQYKGMGIGYLLGQAIVAKAKALQAKSIYLESNTNLVPALNLYRKLGFVEVTGLATPYERCNIKMELLL